MTILNVGVQDAHTHVRRIRGRAAARASRSRRAGTRAALAPGPGPHPRLHRNQRCLPRFPIHSERPLHVTPQGHGPARPSPAEGRAASCSLLTRHRVRSKRPAECSRRRGGMRVGVTTAVRPSCSASRPQLGASLARRPAPPGWRGLAAARPAIGPCPPRCGLLATQNLTPMPRLRTSRSLHLAS